MMAQVEVNKNILDDEKYEAIFSVEEVNRLTLSGVSFRDAYKKVGLDIEAGNFKPEKTVHHTHEGSIGKLCNAEIATCKNSIRQEFTFDKMHKAEAELLK